MAYAVQKLKQALDRKGGRFTFTFTKPDGSPIAIRAYMVGLMNWKLYPTGAVPGQTIKRVSVSNTAFLEGGIGGNTLTVTPVVSIHHSSSVDIDRSLSTLTLSAIVQYDDDGQPPFATAPDSVDNDHTVGGFTLAGGTSPQQVICGFNLQYDNAYEVQKLKMKPTWSGSGVIMSSASMSTSSRSTSDSGGHASLCLGAVATPRDGGLYVTTVQGQNEDRTVGFPAPMKEVCAFLQATQMECDSKHDVTYLASGSVDLSQPTTTSVKLKAVGSYMEHKGTYSTDTQNDKNSFADMVIVAVPA